MHWHLLGFFLLNKNTFFMLSRFSLIIDSQGTLHLALGLVRMYSVVASINVVAKFSYSSIEVCLSDVSRRVSNLFFTVTTY